MITGKQIWAMFRPDGTFLADSDFKNEMDAWKVGLGWPSESEIEDAKKQGYRVVLCTLHEIH